MTPVPIDPIQSGPASTKSDFNVEVVRVTSVAPHPNADRLDIAIVYGLSVVVRRGDFRVGDLAVYVPVDALVPVANPAFAFLASARKVRPYERIRAARLRGVYSEGLLVKPDVAIDGYPSKYHVTEGQNVQDLLKIEKWLSPADRAETSGLVANPNSRRSRINEFNRICPVYGLDSVTRFPEHIPVNTPVVLTEKIHGSNARFSYQKGRFWIGSHRTLRRVSSHRLLMALKAAWAFIVGLFFPRKASGFYAETLGDIWVQIAEQELLEARLRESAPGLVVYGEIYGKGLQRRGGVDFVYDSPEGLKFRVFDILNPVTGRFLSYVEMSALCRRMGLAVVPGVAALDWPGNAAAEQFTKGGSLLGNHIREGVVVRTDINPGDARRSLKYVSADYKLLGDGEP